MGLLGRRKSRFGGWRWERPRSGPRVHPVPGAYTFGVCPAGDTAPVCERDPATVPKAMDVITPPGVSQATELDPTRGPLAIRPVAVP